RVEQHHLLLDPDAVWTDHGVPLRPISLRRDTAIIGGRDHGVPLTIRLRASGASAMCTNMPEDCRKLVASMLAADQQLAAGCPAYAARRSWDDPPAILTNSSNSSS